MSSLRALQEFKRVLAVKFLQKTSVAIDPCLLMTRYFLINFHIFVKHMLILYHSIINIIGENEDLEIYKLFFRSENYVLTYI